MTKRIKKTEANTSTETPAVQTPAIDTEAFLATLEAEAEAIHEANVEIAAETIPAEAETEQATPAEADATQATDEAVVIPHVPGKLKDMIANVGEDSRCICAAELAQVLRHCL